MRKFIFGALTLITCSLQASSVYSMRQPLLGAPVRLQLHPLSAIGKNYSAEVGVGLTDKFMGSVTGVLSQFDGEDKRSQAKSHQHHRGVGCAATYFTNGIMHDSFYTKAHLRYDEMDWEIDNPTSRMLMQGPSYSCSALVGYQLFWRNGISMGAGVGGTLTSYENSELLNKKTGDRFAMIPFMPTGEVTLAYTL